MIDLLAEEEPVDLLADEISENTRTKDFEDLSPNEQEKVLELSKQQISSAHPNMPDWLKEIILNLTPKNKSPLLSSSSKGITDVINYIPATAGGILQGASIPIRGVAGLIPTEATQKLASSPDLRGFFPEVEGTGQKSVQMASELLGGAGLFGKLMGGIKGASSLANVPKSLQNPLALGGAGAIATPGGTSDRALGAGGALALGGAANLAGKASEKVINKLPEFMRGLTSKSNPELLVSSVQKPHDKLQSTADELYSQVRDAVKKRDIKFPITEEFLTQAREYFPKNKSSVNKLFEQARQGDYEAVHKIQSSLYKKGTKQLSGDDLVKENEGEEIMDLRDRINDFAEKHLLKEGNIDVAHVLRQAKKTHKKIMDTYYAPNLRKGIGKMVQSELRLVPEKPEKLFNQNSVPMKEFLGKHEETAKHLQGMKEKEKAMKLLNKAFIGTGIAGGTASGGKLLYDLIK